MYVKLNEYRVGMALFEALDELILSGHINPQLANKVLTTVSSSPFLLSPFSPPFNVQCKKED